MGMSFDLRKFINKTLQEVVDSGRELGRSLADQMSTPYVVIYRAAPMSSNAFFDKDYVTLSKKFAIEHAENNHVYHEDPFHVIQALVSTKNVFDAYNPGEYFYSGPDKKAKEIYVSKGPDEYEGLEEIANKEKEYVKPYKFYMLCDKLCRLDGVDVKNKMLEDSKPISKNEFISNCAYSKEMIKYEGNMLDDSSHGFYASNVKGIPCMYMQYAGFEFIFLKDAPGGQEYWLENGKVIKENSDMTDFRKWRNKYVTYRGLFNGIGNENGAGARFGQGLYTASLSNKTMAKGYGELHFVFNGRPKNPIIFKDVNQAEIWLQQNLYKKHGNLRNFNAITTIPDEMLKLGYDGLEIKGREIVNYKPEDVKYFSNERQLIQYYEDNIENKNTVQEFIAKTLQESIIGEEYPKHFDMSYFKALKTFRQRIQYCQDNLQRINAGSSRIVYKIDDEKVLKLAKNGKGIAQNEEEINNAQDSNINYIVTKMFNYDPDNLWVEMELARPMSESDFKTIIGLEFKDYCKVIHNHENEVKADGTRKNYYTIDKELEQKMWENEFVYEILNNVIGTYDLPSGDLKKLSSYGIVKRGGQEDIVLVDFGLTEDVYSKHYSRALREGWTQNLAAALSLFTSVALGQNKTLATNTIQSTEQTSNQSAQVHSAILGYLDIHSREIVDSSKDKFQMASAIKEVRIYCQNMRDGKSGGNLSVPAKALFKTVSSQLKSSGDINYYVNQGKGIHR